MAAWRILGTLVVALAVAAAARAQTYTLKEAPLQGNSFHLQLKMKLSGELKIHQEDKFTTLKQSAEANHDFLERVLDADDAGTIRKTLRSYKEARAVIDVNGRKSEKTFRPERSLMVAQRYQDQPLTFCPKGALTREEVELTEHFDTLSLPALLAGKDVAVGDTWKLSNAVAQGLCDFDGLTAHDLTCKLESVKEDVAVVSLSGTATGIDTGAAVNLEVTCSYKFDLKARRITSLEWKQNDKREEGPASPAMSAEICYTLERAAVEEPTELNPNILPVVPPEQVPPESMLEISYADPKGRYEMNYHRDWLPVARTDDHLVLRLLDRGDFVAQATVTFWNKAAKGQHLSREEFKEQMSKSPGWELDQIIAEEIADPSGKKTKEEVKEIKEIAEQKKGYCVYRMAALGDLNGMKAMQYFYLVAGPEGDQMVVAFTLTAAQAQKLGNRELALVRNISFPAPREGAQLKAADAGTEP